MWKSLEKTKMSRHIQDDPVAVEIQYKRKNTEKAWVLFKFRNILSTLNPYYKCDHRAFTIDKEDTYNYDKFIEQITVKFKLQRPFNNHYILKHEFAKLAYNRIKVKT